MPGQSTIMLDGYVMDGLFLHYQENDWFVALHRGRVQTSPMLTRFTMK